MYKKLTVEELSRINNNLISHLVSVIEREHYQGVNDFFKYAFREGNELLFFERGNLMLRILLKDNMIHLSDEMDKIEIEVPIDHKGALSDLVKKFIIKKGRLNGQKTIEEILMEEFTTGNFLKTLGKPYLVYDIETSLIKGDLRNTKYYLWYSFEEVEPWKGQYECIMLEDLPQFVEKMLNFDGYIVGFNQCFFDNPVCIYNLWGTDEQIQQLNEKSIDLFLFIHELTHKRIGLNKICDALVSVTKTLDSWADVEGMWTKWEETHDDTLIEDVKKYCKNDVRMTALLFFYFLHFKKLYMDDEEYVFTISDMINHRKTLEDKEEKKVQVQQSLF